MKLKIKDAYIVNLAKYPGTPAPTQVLVVAGILSPPLADQLRLREGCFNEEGVPRSYERYPSSTVRIDGADVRLVGKSYRSTLVHKFTVTKPKKPGERDISLEVTIRLRFAGRIPLASLVDTVNKEKFELTIDAAQGDLQFGEDEKPAEKEKAAEDDRQLSLEASPCPHCAAGIGFEEGSTSVHENGQRCKVAAHGTLASVTEMGGRKKRRLVQ